MREVAPVDETARAEVDAILAAFWTGGHRDWNRALGSGDLDRLRAKSPGTTPDQDDIILRNRMRVPRAQHAIRRGANQSACRCGGPTETGGFGQELLRLRECVLRKAPPIRLVPPDPCARRDDRVAATGDPWVGGIPDTA